MYRGIFWIEWRMARLLIAPENEPCTIQNETFIRSGSTGWRKADRPSVKFVIQKHAAAPLRCDFKLEVADVPIHQWAWPPSSSLFLIFDRMEYVPLTTTSISDLSVSGKVTSVNPNSLLPIRISTILK